MVKLLNKLRRLHHLGKMDDAFIEVVELLTKFRDSGTELSVTARDPLLEFKSVVRATSPRHRVMVIDTPECDSPVCSLQKGQAMTIAASSDGREIKFQSRFIEPFLPNPEFGLQLEMPHFLGVKQQRGAFRVFLEEFGQHVAITLLDRKDHRIDGVVRNISISGVGMKTQYQLPDEISDLHENLGCVIQLDDDSIECQMEVRNIAHRSNGQEATYVGGRMLDVNRRDANKLEDFIQYLIEQRVQTLLAQ